MFKCQTQSHVLNLHVRLHVGFLFVLIVDFQTQAPACACSTVLENGMRSDLKGGRRGWDQGAEECKGGPRGVCLCKEAKVFETCLVVVYAGRQVRETKMLVFRGVRERMQRYFRAGGPNKKSAQN